MCVIVNLHFDILIMNLDFEPNTHISYVDQTKCKVPPHTKYLKGCSCFVMNFGARTTTFLPHNASWELPTLAFTIKWRLFNWWWRACIWNRWCWHHFRFFTWWDNQAFKEVILVLPQFKVYTMVMWDLFGPITSKYFINKHYTKQMTCKE